MGKDFETIILIAELEGMLSTNMWYSPTRNSLDYCYFPKKFGTQLEKELIYMYLEKKFHSFCTFELMLHFLVEEDFLNMHSDILLNIIPRV